jgi:hypothetical protein
MEGTVAGEKAIDRIMAVTGAEIYLKEIQLIGKPVINYDQANFNLFRTAVKMTAIGSRVRL